ncbi:MAG TPA: ABC transporter ATP-binding protein [Rhodobacteraceae bacterium]|nr:ABC transporter ATP-binding protein [Paracoccaceae bacterium]
MYKLFENLVDPFSVHDEGTPPTGLWDYFKEQVQPFKRWIPAMFFTGLFVALFEAGMVFYAGRLVDMLSVTDAASFWNAHGTEMIVVTLLVLFLRPALITINSLLLEQTLVGNMQERVRWRAHKHMLGQSMSFFQNDFAGRLSNRVMQIGPAVEDNVYMMFEAVFYAGTYALGALLVVSGIDWRVALPLVIWLLAYGAYNWWIASRVAVASEKWSDARSMVTGRVVDAYANIETVKLFSADTAEERYVLSALRRLRLRFQRFLRLMTELSLGLNLINGFLFVAVNGAAIALWTRGQASIGEVAAVSALTLRLSAMSGWIMWVTIRLFENAGTIREGLRSVAVDHDVVDKGADELVVKRGEIEFDDLSHHYGKGSGGLDHVSLVIQPGEKVGLIGRSGAGKSSLVNLLLRFRDAEQGRILIDGQDVGEVTQASLRRAVGVVTQDNSLLHRSIRANILYGRPGASEAEMIEAAKRAEAHEFILELEDPKGRRGYDAHVGERGVKLSGGQRQRIAIARMILKDAPILVLDEATSALDSEVEAAIQDTLYGVMEGKTVIAIAHRLSTIARMDRIIVIDEGRIVEQGSHAQLLAAEGLYSTFWNRQSGGFIGTEEDAA